MELQLYEEWAVGLRVPFDFFAADAAHFIELGYVNEKCEAALGKKSKQCTLPGCQGALARSLWGLKPPLIVHLCHLPGLRYFIFMRGAFGHFGVGGLTPRMPRAGATHRQAGTST